MNRIECRQRRAGKITSAGFISDHLPPSRYSIPVALAPRTCLRPLPRLGIAAYHLPQPTFLRAAEFVPLASRRAEISSRESPKAEKAAAHFPDSPMLRRCRQSGQVLRLKYTRHEWIAGKMAGEHRVVRRKCRFAFRRFAFAAGDEFTHENERRAMRQIGKKIGTQKSEIRSR